MILGKKWLDDRKTTFDKTTNILRICDWGLYYRFQVKPVGVASLNKKSSNEEEVKEFLESALSEPKEEEKAENVV